MTETEVKFLKRLLIFLFLAALFPIGALAYRLALDLESGADAAPMPVFTIVLDVNNNPSFVTPTPTSYVVVVPNGWTEHALPDQGFALSVPTSWQRLPVNSQELDSVLESVRKTSPDLANALGSNARQLLQTGVRFWASELNAEILQSHFATNVTVTRQTLPNTVSFDTYVLVNLAQLNSLANRNGELNHDPVSISNRPAERVRYNLVLNDAANQPLVAAVTQYLLLDGNQSYVLTYSTRADLLDKYSTVFDQSAASLRLFGQ